MDLNKMVGKMTRRLLHGKKTESYTLGCFPLSQDAIVITKCFFTLLLRLPKNYINLHWFATTPVDGLEIRQTHQLRLIVYPMIFFGTAPRWVTPFKQALVMFQVTWALDPSCLRSESPAAETSSVPGSTLPILVMVLPLIGIRRMGM